jgi:glycosyltransferase involved in cell wall biosynthesis
MVPRDCLYSLANSVNHEDFVKCRSAGDAIPNILYLSNFVAAKGVLDFLDACSILVKKGWAFNIFLAGNPSKSLSLASIERRVVEIELHSHVKHIGPAYGEEKKLLLRKADILVFPTYFDKECFPLVLLEAMSYGIAVVTTDEGAISEIIENGKTGLIAQKRNPTDLASKIAQLLDDKEFCEFLGRNGHSKFLTHYTNDIFQQEFKRIIGQIVQNQN